MPDSASDRVCLQPREGTVRWTFSIAFALVGAADYDAIPSACQILSADDETYSVVTGRHSHEATLYWCTVAVILATGCGSEPAAPPALPLPAAISADDFIAEFRTNPDAGSKYRGQEFVVVGRVVFITHDNSICLTDPAFDCDGEEDFKEAVSKLRVGDIVSIKGKCVYGDMSLHLCEILD